MNEVLAKQTLVSFKKKKNPPDSTAKTEELGSKWL
jgi:hypothetical protein